MDTSRRIVLFLLIAALSYPAAPVVAAGADKDEEGIPATDVARLKINKGTAWVRPADSGEWEEYSSNSPVAERSRVSVPSGSEAEILFRGSQSLLLRGGAEVEIRELGEKHVTFRLQSGQMALSLPQDEFAPVRVRVPGNREAQLNAPGRYAFTADGGSTKFLVSAGEGTVAGEGATPVPVKAGEEASIGKEIRVGRAESTAPASPGPTAEAPMTEEERQTGIPPAAAGELRDYGKWVWTAEYGYVWSPYVADDWTPYYYGRWAWVYPYGWTWVAYEPWGWWPYHFGWWVSYPAFGWVWCPFNSFVSVDFVFARSRFFFHRGFFFSANVVFRNDGRFVRWTPARPGTAVTRATFSRGDTRLPQWNQPLARGAVLVRGEGGRLSAWQGRGGRAGVGASIDRATGRGGMRSFADGGGRVSARPKGFAGIGRSPAGSASPRIPARAGPGRRFDDRGLAGGAGPRSGNVSPRNFSGALRGADRSFGGPGGGSFRGFEGRTGGFGDGGFRGFGGGGGRGMGGGSMR